MSGIRKLFTHKNVISKLMFKNLDSLNSKLLKGTEDVISSDPSFPIHNSIPLNLGLCYVSMMLILNVSEA